MMSFKRREIIYRPYEPILKTVVDLVLIICFTYLFVISFFDKVTVVGHSMNDTLKNDDKILVNTIAYNFHNPDRYDLIVFKPKIGNVSEFYVKRVIGLPGETIQIKDGKIYIDKKELKDDVITTEIFNPGIAANPVTLSYNEYFVLGDNRNNSDDSRFSNVGIVTRDSIIGEPWFRISPVSSFGFIGDREPAEEESTTQATEE